MTKEFGERVRRAREARKLTQEQLADLVGYESQSTVVTIESGETTRPGRRRELAEALGIPLEEVMALTGGGMDRPSRTRLPASAIEYVRKHAAPPPDSAQVPVYGIASGGDGAEFIFNGQAIAWVPRTFALDGVPGGYAVYVAGNSMVPRYRAGETIWVHPHRPPRPGDDVVVQTIANEGDPHLGIVKELVRKTDQKLVLRQFNPPKEITIPMDHVVAIHRVVLRG